MATISDKRLQHSTDGTAIDYYDADVQSAQEYYAFGSVIPGRTYLSPVGGVGGGYRYGFNGKENDNEVKKDQDGNNVSGGQQDYGMRIYDPRLGRFLSVDPLQQKFAYYTPYQFAGNTPVQAVDLDGLEPASVVTVKFRESVVRTEVGPLNLAVYRFTDVATHLLSFVSGMSEKDIAKIEIINSYGTYVPSYNPSKGGGGITIPSKSDKGGEYQIRFTNNFFADDGAGYKNHYGKTDESNNTMDWLALSSHEVGHIKDITEIGGGILKYFSTFAVDYLKSGSHNGTPRETRADHGAVIFQRFTDFTNKNYGNGSLNKLFNSLDKDADKIKSLDTWFKAFSTAEEQKVFPNNNGNEDDKKTKP